jgi:hypothetical protein
VARCLQAAGRNGALNRLLSIGGAENADCLADPLPMDAYVTSERITEPF